MHSPTALAQWLRRCANEDAGSIPAVAALSAVKRTRPCVEIWAQVKNPQAVQINREPSTMVRLMAQA